MNVPIQLYLPSSTPTTVTGALLVHARNDGLWEIGYSVTDPRDGQELALGALAPQNAEEAARTANDLLAYYLRVLPSVVDAPPF